MVDLNTMGGMMKKSNSDKWRRYTEPNKWQQLVFLFSLVAFFPFFQDAGRAKDHRVSIGAINGGLHADT
jgi:hypothetical protein